MSSVHLSDFLVIPVSLKSHAYQHNETSHMPSEKTHGFYFTY